MEYSALKLLHVSCAGISYFLFVVRGVWMMRGSALLQNSWVRTVPHVVDTILLASAIALAIIIHQYPLMNAWLTAKVGALLVYIGLGMVALRRGKTLAVRTAAWLSAQAAFFYMVAVAVTRNPLPFLG